MTHVPFPSNFVHRQPGVSPHRRMQLALVDGGLRSTWTALPLSNSRPLTCCKYRGLNCWLHNIPPNKATLLTVAKIIEYLDMPVPEIKYHWLQSAWMLKHGDILTWSHFPYHWLFVLGIHRYPVDSQHTRPVILKIYISLTWISSRETNKMRGLSVLLTSPQWARL